MAMGPVQSQIEKKLKDQFQPEHLEVLNESHMHSVPPGSETHFRVFIVSSKFENLSRVKRQQAVYAVVDQEMRSGVHAMGLQTLTPSEWAENQSKIKSPKCANK